MKHVTVLIIIGFEIKKHCNIINSIINKNSDIIQHIFGANM